MAYDSESDRVIMSCGFDMSGPSSWSLEDTWAYDLTTNTWTQMKAKAPVAHLICKMAYDSESDRIILFGGWDIPNDQIFQDTWAYDYNTDTWTDMKPAVSPPGRNAQSMTYDSKADRILLWGGDSSTNHNPNPPKNRAIWSYDFNTNTWEERVADLQPPQYFASAMAYDTSADRSIFYGGTITENGSTAMWAYDYSNNAWIELKPSPNPGLLSWNEMVYLPIPRSLFLFGGVTGQDMLWGKTWLYDYPTNTWTEVVPKP